MLSGFDEQSDKLISKLERDYDRAKSQLDKDIAYDTLDVVRDDLEKLKDVLYLAVDECVFDVPHLSNRFYAVNHPELYPFLKIHEKIAEYVEGLPA